MRILITNDDGIDAAGLRHLYEAVAGLGERWVVAPDQERSGVSHAFSIRGSLRVNRVDWIDGGRGYAVSGTPVDAVKLAIRSLMPDAPDIVLSGINRGENSGVDLLYSGTVAGAVEGAVFGVPAVALSLASKTYDDYSVAGEFARGICQEVMRRQLPEGLLLNINVPPVALSRIAGVRVTRQAESRYIEHVERYDDEKGGDCYWVEYRKVLTGDAAGTDVEALQQGYISVTPVHSRFTAESYLNALNDWDLALDHRVK